MKNIFRRAVQFRESLSQKLEYVKSIVVIVYDLLNRQQPSNLGVTCIRSLEEELKGGKRVAKVCEVEIRVNLGSTMRVTQKLVMAILPFPGGFLGHSSRADLIISRR